MSKKLEVNFETKGKHTLCPLGGKSYSVSVDETCKECPYLTEIKPKNSKEAIPAKVHCSPPIKHANVIFDYKQIEWNTLRKKQED